jgi:hypothetical protein
MQSDPQRGWGTEVTPDLRAPNGGELGTIWDDTAAKARSGVVVEELGGIVKPLPGRRRAERAVGMKTVLVSRLS